MQRRMTPGGSTRPQAPSLASSNIANAAGGSPSLGLPTDGRLTNNTPPCSGNHGLRVPGQPADLVWVGPVADQIAAPIQPSLALVNLNAARDLTFTRCAPATRI
jgi:hypothetical protein